MKQLWYKKYRPKTLDGFVFVDDHIKSKIEEWVSDKAFPHMLLCGSPGTGKCLDGSEYIDIQVDINTLTSRQLEMLREYKID